MRIVTVVSVCLLLVNGAQAEDYQGRVVKVEKDKLTLAVTWRGAFPKGAKVDPPATSDFTLAPKLRVLDFNVKEVKDEEIKKKILKVGEYVIVRTEQQDKKDTAISVQTLPGAGAGGQSDRGTEGGARDDPALNPRRADRSVPRRP